MKAEVSVVGRDPGTVFTASRIRVKLEAVGPKDTAFLRSLLKCMGLGPAEGPNAYTEQDAEEVIGYLGIRQPTAA